MAESTRFNVGCGPPVRPSSTCVLMRTSLSIIESGVNSARDKTEIAAAFIEMFSAQLLNTSVTRDHTMRLPSQSRICRSPSGWRQHKITRSGHHLCQYALVTSKNSTCQLRAAASARRVRSVTRKGVASYRKSCGTHLLKSRASQCALGLPVWPALVDPRGADGI